MEKKGYLVLANGRVFEGVRFGADRDTIGELVFNTAMTGYTETLTDPSYCGQIIMQTFPLAGNYGIARADFESPRIWASGYVVREHCEDPSNYRCDLRLEDFLKEQNVPGLYGVDTRAVSHIIRNYGTLGAAIVTDRMEIERALAAARGYSMTDAVSRVTGNCEPIEGKNGKRVVLWDFGAKRNIVRELAKRGYTVRVVPATATAEEIRDLDPDGIMLSNGPGDPADNPEIIREVEKLWKLDKPIFGICLGHQLLALSRGASTRKLKFGHRGVNHAVKKTDTGRCYLTSQNHGYEVVAETLDRGAEVEFISTLDGSVEGISYPDEKAFTVQFHPEGHPGPIGGPDATDWLFDRFGAMME